MEIPNIPNLEYCVKMPEIPNLDGQRNLIKSFSDWGKALLQQVRGLREAYERIARSIEKDTHLIELKNLNQEIRDMEADVTRRRWEIYRMEQVNKKLSSLRRRIVVAYYKF